jgi:hypothetical protein
MKTYIVEIRFSKFLEIEANFFTIEEGRLCFYNAVDNEDKTKGSNLFIVFQNWIAVYERGSIKEIKP